MSGKNNMGKITITSWTENKNFGIVGEYNWKYIYFDLLSAANDVILLFASIPLYELPFLAIKTQLSK